MEVEPVNNAFGGLGWHLASAQPWLRTGRGTNGAVQAAMASIEGRSSRLLLRVSGSDRLLGEFESRQHPSTRVCVMQCGRDTVPELTYREDEVCPWRRLAPRECLDWSNSASR